MPTAALSERKKRRYWHKLIAEIGFVETWANAQEETHSSARSAAERAFYEHVQWERLARPVSLERRDSEMLAIARETRDIVREGNTTRNWILLLLFFTLLVAVATCSSTRA